MRRVTAIPLAAILLAFGHTAGAGASEVLTDPLPSEVSFGAKLTVAGHVAPDDAPLALQESPFPYAGFATVARTRPAPDGGYAFAPLRAERNVRVRVVLEASPAVSGPVATVLVDPRVHTSSHSLGPGRVSLHVSILHTPSPPDAGLVAWWYLAAKGSRVFHLAAATATAQPSPQLTTASAVVDPPARRFLYRVCLNPPWEPAMGGPESHGPCPHRGFRLSAHA